MQIYWGSSHVPKAAKLKFYSPPTSHWDWLSVVNKIIGYQSCLHPGQNTLRDIPGASFALFLSLLEKEGFFSVHSIIPSIKNILVCSRHGTLGKVKAKRTPFCSITAALIDVFNQRDASWQQHKASLLQGWSQPRWQAGGF